MNPIRLFSAWKWANTIGSQRYSADVFYFHQFNNGEFGFEKKKWHTSIQTYMFYMLQPNEMSCSDTK